MISKVQLKNMAINLRKSGCSYNEILKELGVSKSTLSVWLKDISLSEQQNIDLNNRLKDKVSKGRLQASIALRARRMIRERDVFSEAKREFEKNITDSFFVLGISLYWAEGSKKSNYFQFVNSDPAMVILMVKWIKKYLGTNVADLMKYRLFIHLPYKNENCEGYWAHFLGVPLEDFQKTIYKPTPHIIKKNPDYKGCFRISITRIGVLRKIIAWQKLLIGYYS